MIRIPESAITITGMADHDPGIGDQDASESMITMNRNQRSGWSGISTLLIGPPGVGKSHAVTAIAVGAIRAGYRALIRSTFDLAQDFAEAEATGERRELVKKLCRVELLVLEDLGMKRLGPLAAEDLLEVFVRRHEAASTIVTTNRPTEDWGKFLGDVPAATAILDRFLAHVEVVRMQGKSYRLRNRKWEDEKKEA